jgi:hypothetical protein
LTAKKEVEMKRLASKLRYLWALAFALALMPTLAQAASANELSLDGVNYLHRWSKNGQNEFTPPAESDLSRWTDMITLNVIDKVSDGEKLAELANRILGTYQAAGKILRTNSLPRTQTRSAEHFIGAVLGSQEFLEAVFARVVLIDGTGLVIVHSHRIYGQKVGPEMADWLRKNGPRSEQVLMDWSDMPGPVELRKLPQNSK